MNKEEAIKNYKFSVLDMLRHVSLCSTAEFIDSVNQVLKARKELLKYDVSVEEAMKRNVNSTQKKNVRIRRVISIVRSLRNQGDINDM